MSLTLTSSRGALAAGVLATALLATSALADTEQSSTQLFLKQEGCGATAESGVLSTEAGVEDGADGCGVIGGLPLNEALHQVEDSATADDYSTRPADGVPLVLDAARDLEGVFAVQSWTGGVGGVGEVVIELTLVGRTTVDGKAKSLVLGSGEFTESANPTATRVDVPFAFDLPEAQQGLTFTALTLSAVTRGANLNAGAQSLNGTSHFTVPTLVETVAEPAGNGA